MRPRILFGAFLVFAFVAAMIRGLQTPPPSSLAWDPRASVENSAPRGARALYLWLRELGYSTRTWRKPLTTVGADQQAMFVLQPTQEVTPAQASALFEWVEGGGVLFVAPGYLNHLTGHLEEWVTILFDDSQVSAVRGDRAVPDDGERWRYRTASPDERGLFSYPVEEVAFLGEARVVDDKGEQSVLFARDGLGLAAEIYHGDGVIVAFPEVDFLTNRGLEKARNVELVASLVEDWIEPGTEIWFDEYDHGGRVAGSLLTYLVRRRPALFGVVLLAAAVLAVLRWGRALTIRTEEEAKKRRRPTEFVTALGSLYARSRAVAPAWAALAETGRRIARGEPPGLRIERSSAEERDRRIAELESLLRDERGERTEKDLVKLAGAIARTVAPRKEPS